MIPVLLVLSFAPATCDSDDHRCQAERYTALAAESRAAGDDADRALRLYLAHREYLRLFEETDEPGALCRARAVLREARTIEAMPSHLAGRLRASTQDVSARARRAKITCAVRPKVVVQAQKSEGKDGRSAEPAADGELPGVDAVATPELSAEAASPPESAGPATPAESSPATSNTEKPAEPASPSPESSPAVLTETSPSTPAPLDTNTPSTAADLLPVHGRPPPAPAKSARHHGRGLVIAGGVVLSAGLGFAAAASFLGHDLLETKGAADKLHSMTEHPTDEQRAEDLALWQDYRRTAPRMLGLALAGGASVVVAAILLGVGGKRMARAASHTALVPVPGGFAVGVKF